MESIGSRDYKQILFNAAALQGDHKLLLRRDEGLGVGDGIVSGRKRGLLGIDLNVAPPPEEDEEKPLCSGGRGETAAAACWGEVWRSAKRSEAHCWGERKKNGGIKMAAVNSRGGFDEQKGERERRIGRWNALLGAAEDASAEYEKSRDPKRQTIPTGGTAKKKYSHSDQYGYGQCFHGGSKFPPPLAVRSTRGRAVAMPNKYRDSVLDGPTATVVYGRRRSSRC